MKQTFEEFLQEQHGKGYTGTDDDMPEAYEHWTDTMDVADVMDWAEIYGRAQFTAGKQFLLDELKNIK